MVGKSGEIRGCGVGAVDNVVVVYVVVVYVAVDVVDVVDSADYTVVQDFVACDVVVGSFENVVYVVINNVAATFAVL